MIAKIATVPQDELSGMIDMVMDAGEVLSNGTERIADFANDIRSSLSQTFATVAAPVKGLVANFFKAANWSNGETDLNALTASNNPEATVAPEIKPVGGGWSP